jgi:hypothetical protein
MFDPNPKPSPPSPFFFLFVVAFVVGDVQHLHFQHCQDRTNKKKVDEEESCVKLLYLLG